MTVRSSVVGRCTSSIWTVANFSKHRARRQARGQIAQAPPQRDVQTVGQKGDENVGFDPMLQLMVDGAQGQVVFEVFEGGFHFGQLNVKLPQFLGRFVRR